MLHAPAPLEPPRPLYPDSPMTAPDGLRKLAIVPAYNEEGMVGRVVRDIQRARRRASTSS